MNKFTATAIFLFLTLGAGAQNYIGFDAGYLRTHTNVAEYLRTGRSSNLLDSVRLYPDVNSFQANLHADIGLGKCFFLSTGFHYARKGINEVDVFDSTHTYFVNAYQHYIGISLLLGYQYHFGQSRFGIIAATGPQVDFAVGKPNNGVLYSGYYSLFFTPFSRFSETDLSWTVEAGPTFRLGPGEAMIKLSYRYGLSDVLEDTFVIGRSSSFGITAGYSLKLGK